MRYNKLSSHSLVQLSGTLRLLMYTHIISTQVFININEFPFNAFCIHLELYQQHITLYNSQTSMLYFFNNFDAMIFI